MTHAPRHCEMRRSGVTLVELLIVVMVMLMITAVTIPAISPALEGRKTREAARMVEVFLNGARNRAIEKGHPVGVMITPDENEPSQCIALTYVEQPPPYAGDYTTSTVTILGNGGFGAWQTPCHLQTIGGVTSYVAGVSAVDQVFPQGDIGYLQNLAPGDTFTLGTIDGVPYRLYLGEPYIDSPPYNGKFDPGEPFNDVDGSGNYTPPDSTYLDPLTGFFNKPIPPVNWGFPSAVATYTFADPAVAIQFMSPTGLAYDKFVSNTYDVPIYLDSRLQSVFTIPGPFPQATRLDAVPGLPSLISIDSANPGNLTGNRAFIFSRRPVPSSSTVVNLPDSTCIDLGSNYVDPANNIIGVPGSGLDMFVPFSGGSSTLGNFASFRPNPLTDHEIVGPSAATLVNRPLMIVFGEDGTVTSVFSYDERHFIGNTSGVGTPINFTDYQGRIPAGPIYLLIGRRELIDGSPEILPTLVAGTPPLKPIFNVQDPSSLWVSINPRTGLISTTENQAPDLTAAPTATTGSQLQLYLNAQTYLGRSLARAALDMGGM